MDLWFILFERIPEFIPDFEVPTIFTAATPNSQFQAEKISSSEKTCFEEKEGEKITDSQHLRCSKKWFLPRFEQIISLTIRFSNFNKLLRVFAYTLRLLQSHSAFRQTAKFSHPEEYLAAEKRIFILSQEETSAEELKDLRRSQSLTRSSRIIKFNPFLGSDNLLQSTGRTSGMKEILFEVKHPNILDRRQPAVCLILQHTHQILRHQGVECLRS